MKLLRAIIAVLAVSPLLIPAASAADSKNQGYLTDRNGTPVSVRSSGCVRSRDWSPNRANTRCEGTVSTNTQPRKSK